MRFSQALSKMSESVFIAKFGEVYEHSRWIAMQAWQQGLGEAQDEVDGLAKTMRQIVETASAQQQHDLIIAHPDLAGKAAQKGELTADSTQEQADAGINKCTPDEFRRFKKYNQAYKNKFNFPFIMAVKNSNRHQILAAFERRLPNTIKTERREALDQIHKIALFRLVQIAEE